MTIVVIETWTLIQDKHEEFNMFLERWKKLVKERPGLFEELKSWNSYVPQTDVSLSGMNIWEYDNMEDREKHRKKFGTEPELKELVSELARARLIERI